MPGSSSILPIDASASPPPAPMTSSRPPSPSELYFQLFASTSNPRFHGQTVDGDKDQSGKLRPRRRADNSEDVATKKVIDGYRLTLALFQRHLAGEIRLGVAPLLDAGTCRWAVVDIDGHDHNYINFFPKLLEILERAKEYDPSIVPVRSRSGGLHLYIFWDQEVTAGSVLVYLRDIVQHLGLPEDTETRPLCADAATSFQIAQGTNKIIPYPCPGGWTHLPYCGSGDAAGAALNWDGSEMTLEEFLNVIAERTVKTVDEAEDKGQPAPRRHNTTKFPAPKHSPSLEQGNRQSGLRHNLASWLATVADELLSEDSAMSYAENVIRKGMTPIPDHAEWNGWKPWNLCKKMVAKEQSARANGGGPKTKNKSREQCILAAIVEIRETFIVARDPIDRVYFYDNELGRYEFDEHEQFLQILRRVLSANEYAISKADKDKLLMDLALGAPRFWVDPPLNKVNLTNGIFNLETEELEPHTSDHLHPNQFDISWDPAAECPKTDAFLSDIAYDDEVICFYEWAGYLMVPDTSRQKALLAHGSGSNGKSQLLKLMTRLLGRRNYSAVPLAKLEGNNFAGASLVGRLCNFEFDMSDTRLPGSDFFKSVVGADDAINIEKKYKDSSDVRLYTRFVMSCNRYPRSSDNSKGFWRRWVVWSFNKRDFDNCPEDTARIRDSDELIDSLMREAPGIFRKAIQALKAVRKRKAFTESSRMRDAFVAFKGLTDSVAVWLSSSVIKGDPKKISVQQKQLHAAYNKYCEDKGYSILDPGEFSQKVLEYMPEITTELRHGARYFCGVGLPCDYPDVPPLDYKSRRLADQFQLEEDNIL